MLGKMAYWKMKKKNVLKVSQTNSTETETSVCSYKEVNMTLLESSERIKTTNCYFEKHISLFYIQFWYLSCCLRVLWDDLDIR